MINFEMEKCIWNKEFSYEYLETAALEELKCITLSVRHQAVISAEILGELRDGHAETDKNLSNREFALLTLFSECSPLLATLFYGQNASLSFLCMLNNLTSNLLAVQERLFT